MIIVNTGGSLDRYWDVEDRTEYKNEYIEGQIISRIATPLRHIKVAQNLAMALHEREEADRWRMLYGLRTKVELTNAYVWPDVTVYEVPGRTEVRQPHGDETLLDPILIIEVFSPLTESLDRGTKWAHYRTIPSLREYVLVAQDKVSVERFVREGDVWRYSAVDQLDGVLELSSIGATVAVREIYDRVKLPTERTSMLIPPVDLLR
jgi:Uma2 family endonuclease